jgi:putative membrane protein
MPSAIFGFDSYPSQRFLTDALRRCLSSVAGLVACSTLVGVVQINSFWALLPTTILLSFLYLIVRPALVGIFLPFLILSLGVGYLFINTMLFWIACRPLFGVSVDSIGDAFVGSLVMGITHFVLARIWPKPRPLPSPGRRSGTDGPVIDV